MKIAFVTGGSRGLGHAVVTELQDAGWSVIEFSRTGTRKCTIKADLSNPLEAVKNIQKSFREIDLEKVTELLLISNAGVLTPIEFVSRLSIEDIIHNLNVNIVAAIGVIQAFTKTFRAIEIHKTILSVSSGVAQKGYEGWSLYCTGKAGVENFLRSLHKEELCETAPFRVINFNPGVIDTAMQEEIRNSSDDAFPQRSRFVNYKRDGVLAPPQKVAKKMINIISNYGSLDKLNYSVDER